MIWKIICGAFLVVVFALAVVRPVHGCRSGDASQTDTTTDPAPRSLTLLSTTRNSLKSSISDWAMKHKLPASASSPDNICGSNLFWNTGAYFFSDGHSGKITNGTASEAGAYPYQVRLSWKGSLSESFCGGSIISDSVVLTAAHCMKDIIDDEPGAKSVKDLYIYAGDYNRLVNESANEQFRKVIEIKKHENYSALDKDYDFCLLRLRRRLQWSKFVSPVCLPDNCNDACYSKGTELLISGWGKTEDVQGAVGANILQEAIVPLLEPSECKKMPGIIMEPGQLTDSKFCAGGNGDGKDTCQGDSGGPASCGSKGYFTLIGVTSNGAGCGLKGEPGLYANVCKALDWINATIKEWGKSPA